MAQLSMLLFKIQNRDVALRDMVGMGCIGLDHLSILFQSWWFCVSMKLLQLQEQQLICPHLTCLSFLSDYWSFAWAHWFQPVCLACCVSNDLNIILLLFSSVKTLLDRIIKTGRGYPRSFAISAQCCCGSLHTTMFLRWLSPINSFGSTLDVSCVAWGH